MSYQDYKHLLGKPYVSGRDDCYGLARSYYHDVFGVEIVNAARPEGWWDHPDINLIDDFMGNDGWEQIGLNTRQLKIGDGLIFSLITGKPNHVGVYVGNGMFIHHIRHQFSTEDALMEKWKSRLLMIIRHPEVAKVGAGMVPVFNLASVLPRRILEKLV